MEAPPPSPSLSERTRRLEALEKWRGEVDGRIGDVEVRFSQLRQRYNKLCIAVEASQDVRKACKESVGNLQSTMQREITNLKKEIAQMKGTVDDDDEVVLMGVRQKDGEFFPIEGRGGKGGKAASSGTKRPRSIRLKI